MNETDLEKMPWRRPTERSELVHVVVTGYNKRKYPRKFYVSSSGHSLAGSYLPHAAQKKKV